MLEPFWNLSGESEENYEYLMTFTLVYMTSICHLWILDPWWERCTCTCIGHLSKPHLLLANVTQIKCTNSACLHIMPRLLAFPRLVHALQANKLCVWTRSVIRHVEWPSKLVMETRPRGPGTHLPSVLEYESLPNKPIVETVSPESLHNAQLLVHVSNITSPGNAAYQSNFKLRARHESGKPVTLMGCRLFHFWHPSPMSLTLQRRTRSQIKKSTGVCFIVCHPVHGSFKS